MDTTTIVLLLVILFPVAFLALWSLVLLLLSWISGWRRLATSYGKAAADLPCDGSTYRWQSGSIGLVGYRNCLHVGIHANALSLSVPWPLSIGHAPLLIPWAALHDRQDVRVFWWAMTRLRVGTPVQARLLLPTKVFESNSPGQPA